LGTCADVVRAISLTLSSSHIGGILEDSNDVEYESRGDSERLLTTCTLE